MEEKYKGLVLTRKVGELVRLTLEDGRHIDVALQRIDNAGQARLRFVAESSIEIKRMEIWGGETCDR